MVFAVFIQISTQPRISTHLKVEKVNKRPASNKRPAPPPPTQIQIRDNKIPSRRRSFFSEYFTQTLLC